MQLYVVYSIIYKELKKYKLFNVTLDNIYLVTDKNAV